MACPRTNILLMSLFFVACLLLYIALFIQSETLTRLWPDVGMWKYEHLHQYSSSARSKKHLAPESDKLTHLPNNPTYPLNQQSPPKATSPPSIPMFTADNLTSPPKILTSMHKNSTSLLRNAGARITNNNNSESYQRTMSCGLTLFTTLSPRPNKVHTQRNTIENWKMLLKWNISLILFANDNELAKLARSLGWRAFPVPRYESENRLPVLADLFLRAMQITKGCLYAFANGDILFERSFLSTVEAILTDKNITHLMERLPTMIVSRRTNVKDLTHQDALDWDALQRKAVTTGKLFMPVSEDVFISTPNYPWASYPDIVVGIRAYDNWLVLRANQLGHVTIDVSRTLLAIHQDTKSDGIDRQHVNREYNVILLRKLFGYVNYMHGQAPCSHFATHKDRNGHLSVFKRTFNVDNCPRLGRG